MVPTRFLLLITSLALSIGTASAQQQPAPAAGPAGRNDPDISDLARAGEYVFRAGGCLECHTDTKAKGPPLAGGRGLPTPFGTFFAPNITPDPQHGIGDWSEADFFGAMRHGKSPDGAPYYPAFPYPAFTQITYEDLRALWAYLKAQPAVVQPNKPHDLQFPFGIRPLMWGWRLLFFDAGAFKPDPAQSAQWNRGAYLVNALSHCGECHTPRNALGGLKSDMRFAGSADNAEGEAVPNITPHAKTGIGGWSAQDIAGYLGMGMTPDGDFAGGLMGDVIEHSTRHLTEPDRLAMAVYLKSLPPVDYTPPRKPAPAAQK